MQTQREGAREGRREVCRRLGDRQYSLQPCFISKIYATASAGFPRLHVYERKQRHASNRRAWGFCWEGYWCFCSCTLTTLCLGSRGEVSNRWPVSSSFSVKCPVMKRKCQTLVAVFEVERETRESSDYVSVKQEIQHLTRPSSVCAGTDIIMQVCGFTVHTFHPSAPLWPKATTCRGRTGNSCHNFHVIVHSYLPHSLPQPLCPPPAPCACVGKSPQQHSPQQEDLSQEANPAFVYQRSDYTVGCYLSPGRRLQS